jgi:ABC-2 type transport system ATP-binding protein
MPAQLAGRSSQPPRTSQTSQATNGAAISVVRLRHSYGGREALAGIAFDVGKGEIFGLLGPNGGGKTTLFRILSTLLRPTDGTAQVLGCDVVRHRDQVRARLGVVFQRPSLDHKLTVLETLLHHGHLYGMSGSALREAADAMLDRVGLAARARDRVEHLSGGLQRRLELAKALLHRPEILILDEPGTGLDPGARRDFMSYLQEVKERDQVTIALTTHFMDEAERCDRVGILDRGHLVAIGTPAALKVTVGGDVVVLHAHRPEALRPRIQERFGCEATLVDGTIRIERPSGHEFVREVVEAFPGEIQSITCGQPTLEDVFVHRTGHRFHGEQDGRGLAP